jgi:hypothetical protein
VRHDQACEIGIDRHAIHRLVRSGAWIVARPRVYRAAHHSSSSRGDLRSAALWAGDGATMIGLAAASWWDLTDRVPRRAAFAVGPGGNHTTPPGIVAVRGPIGVLDREQVDGVWVLRRSFAALEAAVELGLVDGARLLDRALQQKRIGIAALGDAREAFGQRHGAVLARRLVALAEGGARSEAERDAIRQLRRPESPGGCRTSLFSCPASALPFSISPSGSTASPSRSTGGRTTVTSTGSDATGCARTRW